jgi:4-aminobutyrate aminotransferase
MAMLMRQRSERVPDIRTELPGPKAKALIELDEQFTSPSYTRMYPLAVARGDGAVIEDVDGNRFLDFTAGIAVCSTGHCHPRVVQAIQAQAAQLLHMSGTDFYYAPQAELARKLAEIAPGSSAKRVFFTNSGAEAIEAAVKLARYHTRRGHMLAFFGGFHGRTLGALSLTASKTTQRRGFSPLLPHVTHVEFPVANSGLSDPSAATFSQIENLFSRSISPDEVAAIVVEPIQGEGGYLVPPADFLPRLAALAKKHGILLIADEVQSGMGRTGKMFACEQFGVEPDIVCVAKGIASGMPLGAIIAKSDVMNWPPGSHASTFGGNPVACVAALETIKLLEGELMSNAAQVGAYLMDRLRELQAKRESIVDVRGLGLMVGMELRQPGAAAEVMQRAFRRGLLLLTCGKNTIRFCPPLVIDEQDVDIAVGIVEELLA